MIPSSLGGLSKLGVPFCGLITSIITVNHNMIITSTSIVSSTISIPIITIKDLVVILSRFIRSRTAAGSLLSFVELCLFLLKPSKEYENTTSSTLSLRSC